MKQLIWILFLLVALCIFDVQYYPIVMYAMVLLYIVTKKQKSKFAGEDLKDDTIKTYDNIITDTDAQTDAKFDNSGVIENVVNEYITPPNHRTGDEQIAERMKVLTERSQESILHRTRYTSDNSRVYFQEELDEQEKRIWWEDDTLTLEEER